ncbi:MAG TPA: gluconate 2-dehydrogenase subunit 3 family protein [Gemmatimonadales bacterium]|nr:gluconate 2-dehydrogenase subunit 3 family protein [Gemmatimonadales bacterium]
MERRELIQWLVAMAGLQALDTLDASDLLTLGRDIHRGGAARALAPHAKSNVSVAAERILPGAGAAGVTPFIDKMLADWYTPDERRRFLAGLPDLDVKARARAGVDFLACAEADQIVVLTALDDEVTALRTARGDAANQHWFAMLKYVTVYAWCTSEAGMRALGLFPLPGRYDGCAPV